MKKIITFLSVTLIVALNFFASYAYQQGLLPFCYLFLLLLCSALCFRVEMAQIKRKQRHVLRNRTLPRSERVHVYRELDYYLNLFSYCGLSLLFSALILSFLVGSLRLIS